MAMSIKKLSTTDGSRSTVMLVCGVISFLIALAVAVMAWTVWHEVGVEMGPTRTLAVTVGSIVGVLLAGGTGIWALTAVNRFSGRDAIKCIAGYVLNAIALAIIGAFAIIIFYL